MLKEMIKSTHHLDNILQRLCDANDPKHEQPCAAESPSDSSEESDADFTDCIEASPRNMQPTSSSYFEVTESSSMLYILPSCNLVAPSSLERHQHRSSCS